VIRVLLFIGDLLVVEIDPIYEAKPSMQLIKPSFALFDGRLSIFRNRPVEFEFPGAEQAVDHRAHVMAIFLADIDFSVHHKTRDILSRIPVRLCCKQEEWLC